MNLSSDAICNFFKRHPIFTFFLVAIATVRIGWHVTERQFYVDLIPAKFEISKTVVIDGETGFREGCGVAVFKLSQRTLTEISKRGLSFFDDAITARSPGAHSPNYYPKWEVTPFVNHLEEGPNFWGMSCADDMDNKLKNTIYAASKQVGSYFSYEPGNRILMVIPKDNILILDYWD